jgi:outer membrane biosynthesis protein TonB
MVWNGTIVKEVTRFQPGDITVGEDPKNTFVVPAPNLPSSFRLFHYSKDKQEPVYLLHLTDSMGGKLTVRDTTMSVRDFVKSPAVHEFEKGYRGEVEPGDWGLVSIGDLGFFWQFVAPADRIRSAGIAVDKNLALIGFAMAALCAVIIVAGYALWDEKVKAPPPIAARQAKFIVEKHKEPPKPEKEEKPEGPKETVGKRHMGKEGKAGEPDKPKHLKTKIPRATQATIQKVSKFGALGAIASSTVGGPLKEIFSSDTQGFGDKLGAAMDGTGDEFQMGHGTGGWSTKGTGTGGGGTGWGRVYGTSNIDTGGGRGLRARIGRKAEKKVKYKVTTAPPEVEGFCAKEAINRVVRAHQGGIRFCFERELQRDPKLSGKVLVGWKINLEGRVQFAKIDSSSLQNQRVESCMLQNIRRWIFPKPQGGICVINYPFVFKGGL